MRRPAGRVVVTAVRAARRRQRPAGSVPARAGPTDASASWSTGFRSPIFRPEPGFASAARRSWSWRAARPRGGLRGCGAGLLEAGETDRGRRTCSRAAPSTPGDRGHARGGGRAVDGRARPPQLPSGGHAERWWPSTSRRRAERARRGARRARAGARRPARRRAPPAVRSARAWPGSPTRRRPGAGGGRPSCASVRRERRAVRSEDRRRRAGAGRGARRRARST